MFLLITMSSNSSRCRRLFWRSRRESNLGVSSGLKCHLFDLSFRTLSLRRGGICFLPALRYSRFLAQNGARNDKLGVNHVNEGYATPFEVVIPNEVRNLLLSREWKLHIYIVA